MNIQKHPKNRLSLGFSLIILLQIPFAQSAAIEQGGTQWNISNPHGVELRSEERRVG